MSKKTFTTKSKTQQHFKKASDINYIMKHFEATPQNWIADTWEIGSYEQFIEANHNYRAIKEMYISLPEEERGRYKSLEDFVLQTHQKNTKRKLKKRRQQRITMKEKQNMRK